MSDEDVFDCIPRRLSSHHHEIRHLKDLQAFAEPESQPLHPAVRITKEAQTVARTPGSSRIAKKHKSKRPGFAQLKVDADVELG